jgi:hypothetical protein
LAGAPTKRTEFRTKPLHLHWLHVAWGFE